MISLSIFLTVLLLVRADHHHKEEKADHYCYTKDSKEIAKYVYEMVKDIAKETNRMFKSDMLDFEKILDEDDYKTDDPGEERMASLKSKLHSKEEIKKLTSLIKATNGEIVKLALDRAHDCHHSAKECSHDKEFHDLIAEQLNMITTHMDFSYHSLLGEYLDDLEELCKGADNQIDIASENYMDACRNASEVARDSTVEAIENQVEIIIYEMRENHDHDRHDAEVEEAVHAVTHFPKQCPLARHERDAVKSILALRKSSHEEYTRIRKKHVIKKKSE